MLPNIIQIYCHLPYLLNIKTKYHLKFQAQLVSAVRTALDSSSGPILLEAGLLLASKVQYKNLFLF